MSRISIDVTEEQHKRLKAVAALAGKSLKEYVLEKTLPSLEESAEETRALKELEDFLAPRVEQARNGNFTNKSVTNIYKETIKKLTS